MSAIISVRPAGNRAPVASVSRVVIAGAGFAAARDTVKQLFSNP
jgi:hypothetical protein